MSVLKCVLTNTFAEAFAGIAEGQHPATPMWANVLTNTLSKCFADQFSHNFQLYSYSLTLAKTIFGDIQFSEGMWNVKMRGRPDGLFGVAQIMLCVSILLKKEKPSAAPYSIRLQRSKAKHPMDAKRLVGR